MKFLLRHAFWLAPLITFAGFVSYYLVFVNIPALRDFPWVNLPLVALGAALAIAGLLSGWKSGGRLKRSFLALGTLFSIAVAGLLFAYVFVISYQMPAESETTVALEIAPDFTLDDANGMPVSLADFRGKKVVLSFFRGFW